ncbi:hypothetical protein ACF0H5_021792 [Mactra antiquata]
MERRLNTEPARLQTYRSFLTMHMKDYIQGLHGIGKVHVAGKKNVDQYKFKSSKDINIRVSDDTKTFACGKPNQIQFVTVENKIMPTRKIDTSHLCYGIVMKDDILYVTDWNASLCVYDMNGILLKTITNDIDGNKLFATSAHITISNDGHKMFVGDWKNGLVCLDGKGTHISTIKDNDLNGVDGVCNDGRGNIFVVGCRPYNVVQYNEDGKKIGVVVKQEDRLNCPRSIIFTQEIIDYL